MRNVITEAKEAMARYRLAVLQADDALAATVPELFAPWKEGVSYAAIDRVRYGARLYKCLATHVSQAGWTPSAAPSLFAVIDLAHAGTAFDPIEAARGMEYVCGKCYLDPEDGNVYRCAREGMAAGERIVLHYLPHELLSQSFTEVRA